MTRLNPSYYFGKTPTIWVATRNAKARHPVRYGFPGEVAKSVMCIEHPIWVHVCSEEELKSLPACKLCDEALMLEEGMNDLMKEC